MKRGMKRVYVYQVSYYQRTKRIHDILIISKKVDYTARQYHNSIKQAGLTVPNVGICGVGFATVNGHKEESNISNYRNI